MRTGNYVRFFESGVEVHQAAERMDSDKVLIVCDRGILDNLAYMSPDEFEHILKNNHLDEVEVRDNYDAVFHLVTVAKGAEEFYESRYHKTSDS